MLSFLAHQSSNVAVGRLDHRVEVIGGAAVDFASVDPGEQNGYGLTELMIICGNKLKKVRKRGMAVLFFPIPTPVILLKMNWTVLIKCISNRTDSK